MIKELTCRLTLLGLILAGPSLYASDLLRRPKESTPDTSQVVDLNELNGLFLLSEEENAMSVSVKNVFQTSEPPVYSIRRKPIVSFSDVRFARAGALFQPGGNLDLARNRYETDNRGYWTHLYLKPESSQSLVQAMTQPKRDVVLVMNGVGKGRVEPIDLQEGHWAVANIKPGGPGGYLTVAINTHIMIAWHESGVVPGPLDSDRQEVEYSLKDYIYQYFWQMCGNAIGGAITVDDFARTGDLGAMLYADFIDSGSAEKALKHQWPNQDIGSIAKSFSSNHPPSMQASVFEQVKSKEFRRALVCGFSRFPSWALNQAPRAREYQKMLLTDDDPMIVGVSFLFAPQEGIKQYRTNIIEALNTCFSREQVPLNPSLFDKIADEQLTECGPALARYLRQPLNVNTVEQGIKTLGQLGAFEWLGEIILSRPVTDERQLRRTFQFLRFKGSDDPDALEKSNVLVKLSEAALEGQWTDRVESHKMLVSAMFSFIEVNRKSVPSRERTTQAYYQSIRRALYTWIPKPGGVDVLARLASSAPRLDDVPFFVMGLKNNDLQTASKCIETLSRLEAKEAFTAILAVFDRKDALDDLHPQYRAMPNEDRVSNSIDAPPYERDTIAYKADEALFHLAGGKENGLESVPLYRDKEVLEQRRAYWKRWLRLNEARGDINITTKDEKDRS